MSPHEVEELPDDALEVRDYVLIEFCEKVKKKEIIVMLVLLEI